MKRRHRCPKGEEERNPEKGWPIRPATVPDDTHLCVPLPDVTNMYSRCLYNTGICSLFNIQDLSLDVWVFFINLTTFF